MLLINNEVKQKLLENGKPENKDKDHPPVVYISILGTKCHWLLSELDPEMPNIAFGLCDLGMGFPEMGYVDLNEIAELSMSASILPIISMKAANSQYPLTTYWRASLVQREVTTDEKLLMQAFHARDKSSS
ncbi:MAG TPA: DUF2958 domain-containing protein [Candidatus Wunengus sp. YC63]|uniref:DUF2958 domain-containing protein n=1 Tax=Candidatus Wunengus sp. YC63 TaxID=3367699 RepID=UPI004029748A